MNQALIYELGDCKTEKNRIIGNSHKRLGKN